MLLHTLYPMDSRDSSASPSGAVALAGRTRFVASLTCAAASACAVQLQSSATGSDTGWTTILTLANGNAAGVFTKTSIGVGAADADFAIPAAARYLRAIVDPTTVIAQDCEFSIEGAFFEPANVPGDKAMLTKELQGFELLDMLAERAENDVLEELLVRVTGALSDAINGYSRAMGTDIYRSPQDLFASRRNSFGVSMYPDIVGGADPDLLERMHDQARTPYFDLDLSQPGAGDAIRREVVTQLEHLFRREMLGRSTDAPAQKTLRELTILAPDLCSRLVKRRASTATTWRGR